MITIRFGLHLDGAYTASPAEVIGHAVLGPQGLLGTLELHLGLSGVHPSQSQRVVQYRACLRTHDGPDRFFHASLATDELGASAELLSWRDELYLYGWDGQVHPSFGRRLADLALVERDAAIAVGLSAGQRLQKVCDALGRKRIPIGDVEVVDPEDALPAMWQRVLRKLPTRYVGVAAPNRSGTLLGQLQARLSVGAEGPQDSKLQWIEDGSLRIVRSESVLMAARWLSEVLARSEGSTLVVAGARAQLLDDVVAGNAYPRLGLGEKSQYRPSLQLLPLAMALLWAPLDIRACLEFLTHPLCPLPGKVSRKLAAKLADRPGLQREAVDEELSDLLKDYKDREGEIRKAIEYWLFETRHSPTPGAPLGDALSRAQQLAAYFRAKLLTADGEDRAAMGAAHSQCRALELSLGQLIAQGDVEIRPIQMAKLIAQSTSSGSANPALKPQVGCAFSATHPGAVTVPVDHVVWWQMTAPSMPRTAPWSRSEMQQLAQAEVHVPSGSQMLRAEAERWLRPVLAAQSTLTLVLPAEREESHPVWQQIRSHIDEAPVQVLEAKLSKGDAALGMCCVENVPLPAKKRWWKLPEGIVPTASTYPSSFSALDLYINNPYQWVLAYPARLKTSQLLTLPDEFRLSGSLAHSLIEKLFERSDALQMSESELHTWVESTLSVLIPADGAVLMAPGRRIEMERFQAKAHAAANQLVQHLKRAKVVAARPEMQLNGAFTGGELKGFADLVVTNQLGEVAIIDMKWGGGKKYRKKLAENAHLQLIIYSELLRQAQGAWPRAAYFILSEARLIAGNSDYFSDADLAAASTPLSPPQLWTRFLKSWEWRKEQLAEGYCEVVMEDMDADARSAPPADTLPLEILNPAYNDFRNLAGWEH